MDFIQLWRSNVLCGHTHAYAYAAASASSPSVDCTHTPYSIVVHIAQQCATRSTRPICIPQISHGLGKLEGRCRCGCRGLETGTTNRDSGFRTREQRTAYGDRR